jgi:hypothetical protein
MGKRLIVCCPWNFTTRRFLVEKGSSVEGINSWFDNDDDKMKKREQL